MNPWLETSVAQAQYSLVRRQLGVNPPPIHFTVYVDAIMAVIGDVVRPSVLEVGCGVGHGSELLRMRRRGISFSGLDISHAAIDLARCIYRDDKWFIGGTERLETFEPRDVIVDGSCVLHVEQWQAHLAALRGASNGAVVLHRIPLGPQTAKKDTEGYGFVFPALEFRLEDVRAEMDKHDFRFTEMRKADGDSWTLTFRKAKR